MKTSPSMRLEQPKVPGVVPIFFFHYPYIPPPIYYISCHHLFHYPYIILYTPYAAAIQTVQIQELCACILMYSCNPMLYPFSPCALILRNGVLIATPKYAQGEDPHYLPIPFNPTPRILNLQKKLEKPSASGAPKQNPT